MRRACGWVLALSLALTCPATVSAQFPGAGGPPPGGPYAQGPMPGGPAPTVMLGPDGQPLLNGEGMPAEFGEPGARFYQGSPMAEPGPEPWYGDPSAMQDQGYATHPWFSEWYVRTEYINWTVSEPGDVLLGAPVRGVADPRQPFLVSDSGGNVLGVATVPTTENMSLRDLNGARLTLGMELTYAGYVEVGGFFLERGRSFTSPRGLGEQVTYGTVLDTTVTPNVLVPVQAPRVIGTSTFVNGALANNIELYNQSYSATYQSQMWGADLNYYFDTDRDGFLQFQPLVGFRHLSLREKLFQRGTFRDVTFNPAIDTNSEIDSFTRNNLYGLQGGFRAEAVTKYLVFGVDTKIALAANDQFAKVRTNNFRSNFDPEVVTDDRETHLSPVIDIGVYGKFNVTPQFSLRGGYNFMWIGRVTRPEDNIYYNDRGAYVPPFAFTPADVTVRMQRSDVRVHGLSIGAEYRF